jgi:hypothetical protein
MRTGSSLGYVPRYVYTLRGMTRPPSKKRVPYLCRYDNTPLALKTDDNTYITVTHMSVVVSLRIGLAVAVEDVLAYRSRFRELAHVRTNLRRIN